MKVFNTINEKANKMKNILIKGANVLKKGANILNNGANILDNGANFINEGQKKLNKLENKVENLMNKGQLKFQIGNTSNRIVNKIPKFNFFNKPHLRGLVNINGTCYMNSILQCLSHIPELYNYFTKEKITEIAEALEDQNCLLFPSFREVLVELWNTSNFMPYTPNKFKERLGEKNPLFKDNYPNDAKDLLSFLLMELHEEMNQAVINNNLNNIFNNIEIQKNKKLMFNYFRQNFMNNYRSIISGLFFGMIYIKTQCSFCQTALYNYQLFNFLIFPLQDVLQYKIKLNNYQNDCNYTVSIEDCFKYSQLPCCLNNYQCKCCNNNVQSIFTTYLSILPNIIIIILNRRVINNANVKISFNENLQLKNYVEYLNDECIYELIGVVTHYGTSNENGHFMARCLSPFDGMWYLYNDIVVKQIGYFNKEEFQEGNPYILFYKKTNFRH